jgi:DNA-binding transcriptional ArsR family regulator
MDHLSTTFAALADPTRRAILARLALGETSVSEIAKPFSMSMPAVSKHLKVLEGAGLITRGRDAQWRPCKLEAGPLKDAAHWIENYRKFWEASLDRLEEYLTRLQSEPAKRPAKSKTPKAKAPKSTEKKNDRN